MTRGGRPVRDTIHPGGSPSNVPRHHVLGVTVTEDTREGARVGSTDSSCVGIRQRRQELSVEKK